MIEEDIMWPNIMLVGREIFFLNNIITNVM